MALAGVPNEVTRDTHSWILNLPPFWHTLRDGLYRFTHRDHFYKYPFSHILECCLIIVSLNLRTTDSREICLAKQAVVHG